MMVITTISHVTAAPSRRWLTPGNDVARPERRSMTPQGPSAALQDQHIDAALTLGAGARYAHGASQRWMKVKDPEMELDCPPAHIIPHSAC